MSHDTYTGLWTDWSKGNIYGATLTLSTQAGVLLLAFVASFVTIIGSRLWHIIRYASYQLGARSDPDHGDGIHIQQQSILRNTYTPFSTAWASLQQLWYWRKNDDDKVSRVHRRTLPTTVLSGAYVVSLVAAAVLSGKVSSAATPFRLLRSVDGQCGFLAAASDEDFYGPGVDDALTLSQNVLPVARVSVRDAAIYASQCYQGDGLEERSENTDGCDFMPVPSLPSKLTSWSTDCPFGDLCLSDALVLETEWIESGPHLGINQPKVNQIEYRRRVECAPLKPNLTVEDSLPFGAVKFPDWGNTTCSRIGLNFGPLVQGETVVHPTTQIFVACDRTVGFKTAVMSGASSTQKQNCDCAAKANISSVFAWRAEPVELLGNDRDVSLVMILTDVVHTHPNDDPIFGTGKDPVLEIGPLRHYPPRHPAGAMACAEAHQLRTPADGRQRRQTPWWDAATLLNATLNGTATRHLGLNPAQGAAAHLLAAIVPGSSVMAMLYTRPDSGLRAQESSSDGQRRLSDRQWEIEATALYRAGLAQLQLAVHQFGGGESRAPVDDAASSTADGTPAGFTHRRYWEEERFLKAYPDMQVLADDLTALCRQRLALATSRRAGVAGGGGGGGGAGSGGDTVLSFSVLGLGLIFGLGAIIVLVSALMEPVGDLWGKRRQRRRQQQHVVVPEGETGDDGFYHHFDRQPRSGGRAAAWRRDGVLQMQRLLFEATGQGQWVGADDPVPRTQWPTSLQLPPR